jgi:hypothetical protein
MPYLRSFAQASKWRVVSDLTRRELEEAPQQVREILSAIPSEQIENVFLSAEAIALADAYIAHHVVNIKHLVDAQHIAIASIERVDMLASWNFKQIVNLERIRAFGAVNLMTGHTLLEIRSPREILHEKEI